MPSDVPALLDQQRQQGTLGDVVVLHVGTNGLVTPDLFAQIMERLADAQRVVVVNDKVPRAWEAPNNAVFAAEVPKYPNAVLVDWHGFGGTHPELFYDDGIHLRPEGLDAYGQLIASALDRQATTPAPTTPTTTFTAPSPTVSLPTPATAPETAFDGEQAAIAQMLTTWGNSPSVDATVGVVEDGEALRDTITAVRESAQVQAARDKGTRIHSIELVGDDHAIVNYDILQGNIVTLGNQTAVAIKIDGFWRLSRDTYCKIALYVQVTCPAP